MTKTIKSREFPMNGKWHTLSSVERILSLTASETGYVTIHYIESCDAKNRIFRLFRVGEDPGNNRYVASAETKGTFRTQHLFEYANQTEEGT